MDPTPTNWSIWTLLTLPAPLNSPFSLFLVLAAVWQEWGNEGNYTFSLLLRYYSPENLTSLSRFPTRIPALYYYWPILALVLYNPTGYKNGVPEYADWCQKMWYSPADEAEIVGATYAAYPFDADYFFFVNREKKIRETGSRKSKEKNRRVVCIQGSLEFDFDCMVFSFSFFFFFFLLSFFFYFLTSCIFSKHKRRHRGYGATLSATIQFGLPCMHEGSALGGVFVVFVLLFAFQYG